MAKRNYQEWSKEELIREVEKLEKKLKKNYGLMWEDKLEDVVTLCKEKLPVLEEDKKREIKTDKNKSVNILIEGDNYHALSVLNYTHKGSIDIIYIDPPYNTGNKDFIFNDKIVDSEDSYRHSKWLSFMGKRLKLAKSLLKDTGVIFISIDDNEIAQLKMLMDDPNFLGESNFIGSIVRRRRESQANLSKNLSTIHEYILCYAKSSKTQLNKFIPELDRSAFINIDNDPRGSCVTMPCTNKGGAKYSIITPTGKEYDDEWRFKKETYLSLLKDKRIVFPNKGNGKPRYKLFYNEKMKKGVIPNTWWDDSASNQEATIELKAIFNGKVVFNNPKPTGLIEKLIKLSTSKKGIILDFMAGSGTTGHAVLELNKEDGGSRQFILCTNNENNICIDVCYPRIKKVMEGYKNLEKEKTEGLNSNLKYYKTDFVDAKPTDRNKKKLVDKSTEMLCLKEDCFNEIQKGKDFKIFNNAQGKHLGIVYDDDGIEPFKKEVVKLKKQFVVYVFSLDESAREEEFEDMARWVELKPIPAVILNVYKRIFK